jgi:Ni/Co efflux regulator RcnB
VNRLRNLAALSTLSAVLFSGIAVAQDDHHHQANYVEDHHDSDNHSAYVRHDEWKKGYRMNHDDWNRGRAVDYHAYHLKQPPRGYEWREVDGNYVMAAVATGVIASAIVASAAR